MPKPLTTASRNTLVEEHLTLARRIARGFAGRVPRSTGYDDLEATAFLGLTEAAARYDPLRKEVFAPYAAQWIRGAILDELRRRDTLTRRRRQQAKQLVAVAKDCEARTGRSAASEDLAAALNMSESEVQQVRSRTCAPRLVPLNEDRHAPSSPTRLLADERIDQRRRRELLAQAMLALPARDRAIIRMYYAESLKLRQIGLTLGVTESRVCQLRSRAERTLRNLVSANLSRPTAVRDAA